MSPARGDQLQQSSRKAAIEAELDALTVERVALDPAASIDQGNRIAAYAQHTGNRRAEARAYLVIGGGYGFLGQPDAAHAALDRAAALFDEVGDQIGVAQTILRRNIIWGLVEEFDIALQELPKALRLAEAAGDRLLEAQILDDMAMVFSWSGRAEEAVEAFGAAIHIVESLDEHYWAAAFKINLADLLNNQHDFDSARILLREALAGYAAQDDSLAHDAKRTLARCDYTLGNPDGALVLLNESIAHAEAVSYVAGIADASFDAGLISEECGDREGALRAFRRTVEAYESWDRDSAPIRAHLAAWKTERLTGALTRSTLEVLEEVEARLDSASDETAFMVFDALSASYQHFGEIEKALIALQKSTVRKEQYWTQAALRQAQFAAKKHQVAAERLAAERARQQSRELAAALKTVQALNQQNEGLIAELQTQSELFERQAVEDALTGIGNRRWFSSRLNEELVRSATFQRPLVVALADVDDFKQINDRFTHDVGDQVLIRVAALMTECTRKTDLVARYGGEEFAFLLPETSAREAQNTFDVMRTAIAHFRWDDIAPGLQVSISVGAWLVTGETTAPEIMKRADELMYQAKRGGKNRVIVG